MCHFWQSMPPHFPQSVTRPKKLQLSMFGHYSFSVVSYYVQASSRSNMELRGSACVAQKNFESIGGKLHFCFSLELKGKRAPWGVRTGMICKTDAHNNCFLHLRRPRTILVYETEGAARRLFAIMKGGRRGHPNCQRSRAVPERRLQICNGERPKFEKRLLSL